MKVRYALIVMALALVYGIFTYNQNSNAAATLAGQVVAEDQANQSTTTTLNDLQSFVRHHMGATTSVFLEGSYNRAVAGAGSAPAVDGSVYADAQAACAGRTSSVVQAQCVTNYVSQRLKAQPAAVAPAPAPSKSSYTYKFGSPRWAPDAPGIAFLVAGIAAVVAAGLWLSGLRR